MPKKPQPKADPKPELVVEYEGAPPKLFVIRHKPSGTWWGPQQCGYFASVLNAGTYSEAEARRIEAKRGTGEDEAVPLEVAVREAGKPNPVVLQALASMGGR